MHLKVFLALVDSFYRMLFVGDRLVDMKILYYTREGYDFRRKGDTKRAAESYEKALNLDPQNFYAHSGLATILASDNKFEAALAHANQAAHSNTRDVRRVQQVSLDCLQLAILEMLGESDSVKSLLDKLLLSHKGSLVDVYNRLAFTYLDLGIYSGAERYSEKTIAMEPNVPGFHQNLAAVLLAQHKPEEAKAALIKALEVSHTRKERRTIERQIARITFPGGNRGTPVTI
jgi:Tfp pilus assembly protein PilF